VDLRRNTPALKRSIALIEAAAAFPCNQFGAQEPGSEAGIGVFGEENYGVTFPLFAKIEVNGPNAHPLYCLLKKEKCLLKKEKPGLLGFTGSGAIRWNFTKFLVDQRSNLMARYGPAKDPRALIPAIEGLLQAP
jgi:glutathione peroxidase